MSKLLFDGSDESDNDLQLGTNKDYAKSYNNFRKKELIKKFKDRGLDVSESDSSSESSSSEEDEVLDAKFDQEFFKTLASLKSKNPVIYDKNTQFFESLKTEEASDCEASISKKQKKVKPVTLKDYERKIILERGGKFEDDSDVEDVTERSASPTLIEEERHLRDEFKKVMNEEDSEDEEFGGIFKKREKSKEEKNKEEEDFAKWLAGKKEHIAESDKEKLEPLKSYWSSNKLPQSERFLRDYILSKGYANTNASEIPTYDEIVGDAAPLSEDEDELEKQAEFEQKYNFRFEEPDSEFIQRYPRTIDNSVRRTDDKRKQKRQEVKERKKQEKEQKMKELDMIKAMKRNEIEEKIKKLKMVTGNDELGFKDEELEEDFDPEAHDRRMQELFNDEYYQVDEGEEKPECPSDIEELKVEDWDNYNPNEDRHDFQPHCEDDDFNMDCDYDPEAAKQEMQNELIENTRKRKSRKGRRNRFMEMIQAEKPAFDPEDERTYEEYIDEYYQMDYEDIIGDTPCRFKYVETTPNDFGLTIEEILLAKNKELNQWASLKKAIQIRPDYIEKKDQRMYKMKAKNEDLKRKIFKSLYGDGSDDEEQEEITPECNEEQPQNNANAHQQDDKQLKKKRKRKAQTTVPSISNQGETNAEDLAVGTSAKKLKTEITDNEQKSSKSEPSNTTTDPTAINNKKKKKKRKNKNAANQSQVQTSAQTSIACATVIPTQNNKKVKPTVEQATDKKQNNNKNPFHTQTGNKFKSEIPKNGKFVQHENVKNKFNKFNNKRNSGNDSGKISDDRLKAYGINPKKFHKKEKYGNKLN